MDHDEQLTALRGLYEGLALEKDDVERENVRLAAQLAEARRGLVEAQGRPEYLGADELVGEGEDFLDPSNLTKRLGACSLCGAMVPEATEQTHTDWHAALDTAIARSWPAR